MYEIYDQLDYFICREIAYKFMFTHKGDFKINIEKILIEKEGKKYKIKRPITFIKDILRFSIDKTNDVLYSFYSVKTSISVLGKLMRDFSIDGEKDPVDPLKEPVKINFNISGQPAHLQYQIRKYNLDEFYFKEDQAKYAALIEIIYQNQGEKREINTDLASFLQTAIALRNLEKEAYINILALESSSFLSDLEKGIGVDRLKLYQKYEKKLKNISNGFEELYKNFLKAREKRKLNVKDYTDLVIPKVPFSRRWLTPTVLNKIKDDPKLDKKLSNSLDCLYLSILGQLDTISSTRRHILRGISTVLNNYIKNEEEFKKFKLAVKKLEKDSILLFKGFNSKDKRIAYNIFVNFLISHKKAFDSSVSLLSYIENLKYENGKEYQRLTHIKKALIFYILYISNWNVNFLKRGAALFEETVLSSYKKKPTQKILNYIAEIEKLSFKTESIFRQFGFFEGSDPFKNKRKDIINELKKEINSLKKTLPIHYSLIENRHAIYESHSNYKFGPWFDTAKPGDLFNPTMLLINAFCLLNRAKGEKLNYIEKIGQLNNSKNLDKKRLNRLAELTFLLGENDKKILSLIPSSELEKIKNIKPIPFGKWKLEKIEYYIDKIDYLYQKMINLHKELFNKLEKISQKYLNEGIEDLIFPEYAVPFFFYERDLFDQIQNKKREQYNFTNKELKASIKIESVGKGRNFHQKITLKIGKNFFDFEFKGKDPTRLRFRALDENTVFGERLNSDKNIFSILKSIPYLLNKRNYYLNKILEASESRFSTEHLNLFFTLIKDSTSHEKGVIVSYNYKDHVGLYEFPSFHIKPKFNLTKTNISSKSHEMFEKERMFFLQLKQATRVFESKNKLTNNVIYKLQQKYLNRIV